MLKNKIALKRIRNIIFLGLVMVIMLGIYNNTIKNSRAEDRVQLTAQMQDKNGLLLNKEVPVEAVKNSDGTYSIELTNLVDGKRVSKYFAGDGTEVTATTGTVLIATADQVVENKVSIQLEYDSKQVSNGTNTVAIYNQTLTSNAVTVSGYVPDATTLSAQEIDVATLSEVALPDSNVTIEKAYDITIANYQPSEYGESVNVAISYNPTSSPIVYHIADDNTVTKIDSVLEGRSVKFTANHFSKYAIATQGSGTTDTSTDTNTTTETTNTTVENTVVDTTNTVVNEVTNTVTNTVVENTVANEVEKETTTDTEVPVWSKVSSAITETGMDVVIQGTDNANWGYDELTDEKIEVLIDGEIADSISETEIEKNVAEKFVEIEKEIDERIDADETLTDEEKIAQKEAEKTAAKESLRAEEIKNKIVVKLQNREDVKENEATKGVKFTVSLSNMEQTTKQIKPETLGTENEEYKPYLEWSGNVGLKIAAGTLTDVYANVSAETIIEDAEKTDRQTEETADKMFRDIIKPEYTYRMSSTINEGEKTSIIVMFDVVDKYFGESTLKAENITVAIDGIEDANSKVVKTLQKLQDIEETKKEIVKEIVDGVEKQTEKEVTRKIGERYQIKIDNLEDIKLNGEAYTGPIQLIFAEDAQKDTSENGTLAKTITTEIVKKDEIKVMATEGGTLASQITSANYGDYVEYNKDLNGDGDITNDWRIFYKESNDVDGDGANVFLIAADYLPSTWNQNSTMSKNTSGSYVTYGAYWDTAPSGLSISATNKYMISKAGTFLSGNANYQATASLLTTSYWTNLVDASVAETAIGSPTVEMWMSSWNEIYPSDMLYCNNADSTGYYVGTTDTPTNYSISSDVMKVKAGYNNTLFYPHQTSENLDGTEAGDCYGYWLASPSASSTGHVLDVSYLGYVVSNIYDINGLAVRPVVSLKSNIVGTQDAEGVWTLTEQANIFVDFEAPVWKKSSSSIDRTNEIVKVTLQGTDKNLDKDNSALAKDKITVYTQNTSTGVYEANENISKDLSTVKDIENGIEYTLTLGNFGTYEGKVAIEILEGTALDSSGNSNETTEKIGVGNINLEQTEEPTLAAVTNDNIGDYIDLGNDIVDGLDGTSGVKGLTTDDWRVLYVEDTDYDGENDIIYAILADYLPTEQVPESAGLDTNYPYSVTASSKDAFFNGISDTAAWSGLANGISGATVTGTPKGKLLMNSYNTKNGTELGYTNYPTLSGDLYVPHSNIIYGCWGYWLASPGVNKEVYFVHWEEGLVLTTEYDSTHIGVRPIVSLPVSTSAQLINEVWTIGETKYKDFRSDIVDFVKPEIEYNKSATVLDKTNKKLIVEFDVTDSYCNFDFTAGTTFTASDILVKIDGDEGADEALTNALSKTLTKVADKTEVVNGESKKVGETYRLEISNLDQIDYSGPVNLIFAGNVAKDTSGNANNPKTITVTASDSEDEVMVDFLTPVLKTDSVEIDFEYPEDAATKDATTLVGTATAKLVGSDKYFDADYFAANPIEASDLVVFVDGTEVTEGVTVELLSQKALTKATADGTGTYTYGLELEVKVSGFKASAKQVRVGLKANTVQDTNGNGNTLEDYTEACVIYNTLQSTATENSETSAFLGNTSIKRNTVTKVILESNLDNINKDRSWNVAAQGDSSIVAWLDANDNTIVHIGSENPIHANSDSTDLFYGLTKATAIENIDILNTKNVTNMRGMFELCGQTAMTSLDLGNNFYTKNVTSMEEMFYQAGYRYMTTLNLGDNFDTANVTNMRYMFYACGAGSLTELDLGDKFDVRNVTDMTYMFRALGTTAMTHLDLGPMFTKLTSNCGLNQDVGKNASDETVIDVPEAIYYNETGFKQNADTSVRLLAYTRGTLNPKYYPVWEKTDVTVSNDVLTVKLAGATNENYTANFGENKENVTAADGSVSTRDRLDTSDITVYADGTQVNGLTVNVGEANRTVDANGNTTAIDYTIQVSGFKAANISGDISLGIAAKTLRDEYGNSNLAYEVKDEYGAMFIETVAPEITYDSSTFDIVPENKTITIEFTISDNYEMKSIAGVTDIQSAEAIEALKNAINVILGGEGNVPTKTLTIEEVLTNGEKTLGAKYKLVLSNFGQYYGSVSVAFPDEIAVDKYDNKSIGKTITVADNVDFENPVWEENATVVINRTRDGAATDTVDITFRGLDKEIDEAASTFADASAIEVWVAGTKIDTISKVFASQTAITEEGETKPSAMEYKLTLGNFGANSGEVVIKIPTNTLFDESGLTAEPKEYTIGMVDFIKPVIENISSRLVDVDTVEYTFTVTEKYLATDYQLKPEDINVFVDEEDVSSEVTRTLNIASEDANGKTYTFTITKFKENDLSGTVYITIPEGKVKDSSGNVNSAITRAEGQFVDNILPEITYKYAALTNPDIDKAANTLTVIFNATDKHFDYSATTWLGTVTNGVAITGEALQTAIINAQDATKKNIQITIDGQDITDKLTSITPTRIDGGMNYTFLVEGLEEDVITGDYKDYSGVVQVSIAAGLAQDTNANKTLAKNITIADAQDKPIIVDVIDPIWNDDADININQQAGTVDITFVGTDKYIDVDASTFNASSIEVYVGGTKVNSIQKSFKEIKALTANGETSPYGVQYTLTLSKFGTNTGDLKIVVPANVLKDTNGLVCTTSKTYEFADSLVDFVKPVVGNISSQSTTPNIVQYTFTITDDYFAETNDNKLKAEDIKVYVDSDEINTGLVKTLTETDIAKGKQYTLTLDFTGIDELDGTTYIDIPAGKIADTSGNTNDGVSKTEGEKVDTIIPEWTYVSKDIYYSETEDVNNDGYTNVERTVEITFKGTDTNYNANTLTKDVIEVYVDGTKLTTSNAPSLSKTLTDTTSGSGVTNGKQYTLKITGITGNGVLTVKLPGSTLNDTFENVNIPTTFSTELNVEADNTPPSINSIAITAPATNTYTVGQEVTIQVTYGEEVYTDRTANNKIDVASEAADMSLTFGEEDAKGTVVKSSVNGNVVTYKYTITSGDNGVLKVASLDDVYDIAGNKVSASDVTPTGSTITADTTAPTLSHIKVTNPAANLYRAGQEITIVATFDENVEGTAPVLGLKFGSTAAKGTVGTGTISGNKITYKYTITAGDNGVLSISSFAGTALKDNTGNAWVAPSTPSNTGNEIEADTTAPVWKYVSKDIYYSTANDAGNDEYANEERTVKITFTGTDTNYKGNSLTSNVIKVYVDGTELTSTNAPNLSKTLSTATTVTNGIQYTLTIKGITGDGDLSVTIPANTLEDSAITTSSATGNKNTVTTFSTALNIEADNTSPVINSIKVTSPTPGANQTGAYKVGQEVTIQVTYNDTVYEDITSKNQINATSKAPTMALKFGGAVAKGTVTASSVSGKVITYKYTITAGDNGSLTVASLEAVYDRAGNEVSASNVTPENTITADTTNPTVELRVTSPATTGMYREGQEITITATYSEAVYTATPGTTSNKIDTTDEAPDISLKFGEEDAKGTVTVSSVSGNVVTYKYTITDGDNGELKVSSLEKVYDRAGNEVSASEVTPNGAVITADTTTPEWTKTSSSITRKRDGASENAVEITFTGSDNDLKNCTLTSSNIASNVKVYVMNDSGTYVENTTIKKNLVSASNVTNGEITLKIKLNNFADNFEGKVAIEILGNTLYDNSGNGNPATGKIGVGNVSWIEEIEKLEGTKLTLATVTNNNIGDYIDLGNDIVDGTDGTWGQKGLTTDDWRIFYAEDTNSDGTTDLVHVILADYFPVATTVPSGVTLSDGTTSDGTTTYVANAGLETYNNTSYPYALRATISRDKLLGSATTSYGLLSETAWNGLANGITGAIATGSPTGDLLQLSYRANNVGTYDDFDYTVDKLNSSSNDYNLYVPHTKSYKSCYYYWLASQYNESSNGNLWSVNYNGGLADYTYIYVEGLTHSAIRPIVSIPVSTKAELVNGVWTVDNSAKYQAFCNDIVDYAKPVISYTYSESDISTENNSLTVNFDIEDKYFLESALTESNIKVKIDDGTGNFVENATLSNADNIVVTKVEDITKTVDGVSQKTGERYELVISGFESIDYSGTVQIAIDGGVVTDTSGNTTDPKTITVGIDEPSGEGDAEIVDVIEPVWEKIDSSINRTRDGASEDSVEVVLKGTDKYLDKVNLKASNIGTYIKVYTQNSSGTYVENTSITKTLTDITSVENGEVTATIKLTNFGTYSGKVAVEVQANAIVDESGNGNETTEKIGVGKLSWREENEPEITSTLATVTNDNIGDYIDLGNDIVDFNGTTGVTTDDWRIFYVEDTNNDGTPDVVHAILSDYFPISTTKADGTTYIEGAGLEGYSTYKYSVRSKKSRDTLLTGLTTQSYWNELANGIEGATATGTPTAKLTMNSYNTKNGTNLNYFNNATLDSSTEDYDLYVPHTSSYNYCGGYWFATANSNYFDWMYCIKYFR